MQRNVVTKDLVIIKWMLPRSFTPLRYALDDKVMTCRDKECLVLITNPSIAIKGQGTPCPYIWPLTPYVRIAMPPYSHADDWRSTMARPYWFSNYWL